MENQSATPVSVVFETLPAVNYALHHNHVPVIRTLRIRNDSDENWESLTVSIIPNDAFAENSTLAIGAIAPGETFEPAHIPFRLKPAFIQELTEQISSSVRLSILQGEALLYQQDFDMDVLAFDQWLGSSILPETLSTFVLPNLPELVPIIKSASAILARWTGDGAFSAYQSQNPDRVKKQMAAIYEAIRALNITYCSVPASFGNLGQRVRMVGDVLTNKIGNCLDMSLLYASCLEAVGLRSVLVLIKGHAFAGGWLVEDTFPDSINDDASLLTKRMAIGINEILCVESTAMNEGNHSTFDDAVRLAGNHFANQAEFDYFLDVQRSRFSGIRPLPVRKTKDGQWLVEENIPSAGKNATEKPLDLDDATIVHQVADIQYGKQVLWERKLLDLSLRNNLLNLRISKSSLQLVPVPLGDLEDAMASGDEFQILGRPTDWDNPLRSAGVYKDLNSEDPMAKLVMEELKGKRLRSYLPERELESALVGLFRNARQAMEENGANTLYLALGLLRWYESDVSEQVRFAPILLLPVELIRKTVKKGFVIRSREEETVMNITLLEKLRQDCGIKLSGLEQLPTDEKGVDVKRVFNIIRQAVMNQSRWDVEEQAFVGTFSFNKFIMWNDIHTHAEELKTHPVVAGLINGKLKAPFAFPEFDNLDTAFGPGDIALPITADSSQLEAIGASAADSSFILHGPPGTGKSQTITNMIANALYKGKRVLFVAEKMAALSVVQERLSKIGLGAFCLELHSNKTRKNEVLSQLQRTSEIVREKEPEDFASEVERLNSLRQELNAYEQTLHQKLSIGLSLYDLFNEYLKCPDADDSTQYPIAWITQLDKNKSARLKDLTEQLQLAASLCGGATSTHPLSELTLKQYSSSSKDVLASLMTHFIEARKRRNQSLQDINQLLALGQTDWPAENINYVSGLADLILALPEIPAPFFREEDIPELQAVLKPLLEAGQKQAVIDKEIQNDFTENVLDIPAANWLAEWNLVSAKWFLLKFFGQKKWRNALQAYFKNGKITNEQAGTVLQRITEYQSLRQKTANQEDFLKEKLGDSWHHGHVDWTQSLSALENIGTLQNRLLSLTGDKLMAWHLRITIGQLFIDGRTLFHANKGKILLAFQASRQLEEQARAALSGFIGQPMATDVSLPKDALLEKAIRWSQNIDQLKNWYSWLEWKQIALNSGLAPLVEKYEQGQIPTGKLVNSFLKSLYKNLITQTIDSNPSLGIFNGLQFEAQIRKYRELNDHFTWLTQKQLYATLAAKIPSFGRDFVASSETGILQRAIKSNGRGMSIRKLFDLIPNLLERMSPCMLMSPISVAQYIGLNQKKFDLVIFDEASQMPTSEAVGAIARGNSLIVVGDPKQMPPTSFFSSVHFDEEDMSEDLESILDDCQALNMPSRQLQWHYRSKHESLIAFSNAQYYDNTLFTFPSPDDLASRVSFIPIPGVYDKGKTRQNRAEAEAIVAEIKRLLGLPESKRRSIGVVTFSSVQQTLIEDLLSEVFNENPALEEINNHSPEPLFVKNLENVQGDERDIILFSICYGPDENGKVSLNFGPLNREGGWRRLNVAVSRARYEMKIYSTLHPDQIDLSRTRSDGVAGLKAFLSFAERGKNVLPVRTANNTLHAAISPMVQSIADFLKEKGYKVDINIGCSGFKMDLAIVHPKRNGEYMAAILTDGYQFHQTKSAHDRNIVQESVLSLLGWHIFRIWSMDWWEQKEKLLHDLLTYLEELQAPQTKKKPDISIVSPPETISSTQQEKKNVVSEDLVAPQMPAYNKMPQADMVKKDLLQTENTYRITVLDTLSSVSYEDFLSYQSTGIIRQQLEQVITAEAPIKETLLFRRVLAAWNISRLGSRITARFHQVVHTMQLCHTKDADGTLCYWQKREDADLYKDYRIPGNDAARRAADEIPSMEIINAMKHILEEQISMPAADLVRETARLLGFAKVGSIVEKSIAAALDDAVSKENLVSQDSKIVIAG